MLGQYCNITVTNKPKHKISLSYYHMNSVLKCTAVNVPVSMINLPHCLLASVHRLSLSFHKGENEFVLRDTEGSLHLHHLSDRKSTEK